MGVRRYTKRSPSRKPASTRVFQVCVPQTPSTRRPRRRWNASRAARVAGPKMPSRVDRRAGQDGAEAVLDVGDGVAAVAGAQRQSEGQAYR